jgi:hypothetical protein
MRKLYLAMGLALVAMLVAAGAVFAAVTFDPATGKGFVGKGDVQLAFGWNNQQLQQNASQVTFSSTTVSERSWICDRDVGPQTQERARTTTTEALLSKIARERNQITGFILQGPDPNSTPTESTEGPPLGSCPTGWTAGPISDPVVDEAASGLFVSAPGFTPVKIYPQAAV